MGKYYCRYPGCIKIYKSTSGRAYHERHVHGELYTTPDNLTKKIKKNTN